jgi:hypothetical protein
MHYYHEKENYEHSIAYHIVRHTMRGLCRKVQRITAATCISYTTTATCTTITIKGGL